MGNEYIKGMEKAYNLISQANDVMISLWLKHTLFDWHWWFGLFLTVLPWVIWIIFRRKESSDRLLYVGFFVMVISSWLDVIGILFGLWDYYDNVVPFSPAFIPWDFSLLPVAVMFFLQIKPKVNPLLKAAVFSAISSFVIEPFFVMTGIYNPKHWKHIYSFPIIIVIYLISDYISKRSHFEKL